MTWLTERRLLAAAVAAWLAVAALHVALGPPLGHDESAFAISARSDAPAGAWLYRSAGTVAIAKVGVALGGDDWQLRIASALLGVGVVFGVFAIGRAAFGARTGAWAAAVIAGAHPMAMRSAQLLSDLPSTACVLIGIAILITELERPTGPRWRLVAVGPVFAAAFHVRYGSAPVIGIAAGLAVVVWWRSIVARPLPVVAAALAFGVLGPLPHILYSLHMTGTALGVLELSANKPRLGYVGEGLVTYLTSNPIAFYGVLVGPTMLAGLVGVVRSLGTRTRTTMVVRGRAAWFLALVALGQLIALGLESHAQSRYVYVATALLVVLGTAALATLARPRIALAIVAAAWLGMAITGVVIDRAAITTRAPILAAARAMHDDAGERPCVFVAGATAQLMWYSHCAGFQARLVDEPLVAELARYAVSTEAFPLDVEPFAAAQHLHAVTIPTGHPSARVWSLR